MKKVFLLVFFSCFLGSCAYRSENQDLNTIPITNNPQIIPRGGNQFLPQMEDSRR
ncbi:MAG: hypothetical protein JW769_04685 [Parachlamydiales bacterium]|nr:hypothetical protein [Parachlamydiales bacterium]